ncbi:MAG: hypothetical protein EHM41_24845, partial [Chloroflexi bacterium]
MTNRMSYSAYGVVANSLVVGDQAKWLIFLGHISAQKRKVLRVYSMLISQKPKMESDEMENTYLPEVDLRPVRR